MTSSNSLVWILRFSWKASGLSPQWLPPAFPFSAERRSGAGLQSAAVIKMMIVKTEYSLMCARLAIVTEQGFVSTDLITSLRCVMRWLNTTLKHGQTVPSSLVLSLREELWSICVTCQMMTSSTSRITLITKISKGKSWLELNSIIS